MNRRILSIMVIALPLIAAAGGYAAGPFLARTNDTVQLAQLVWQEEQSGLRDRTFETEVFWDTGRSSNELYAEAHAVERSFMIGGLLLGLWCGLVVSVKLVFLARVPTREVYDIDHGECVACARCFMACPRERLRLKERGTL